MADTSAHGDGSQRAYKRSRLSNAAYADSPAPDTGQGHSWVPAGISDFDFDFDFGANDPGSAPNTYMGSSQNMFQFGSAPYGGLSQQQGAAGASTSSLPNFGSLSQQIPSQADSQQEKTRCPNCHATEFVEEEGHMVCASCGMQLQVTMPVHKKDAAALLTTGHKPRDELRYDHHLGAGL